MTTINVTIATNSAFWSACFVPILPLDSDNIRYPATVRLYRVESPGSFWTKPVLSTTLMTSELNVPSTSETPAPERLLPSMNSKTGIILSSTRSSSHKRLKSLFPMIEPDGQLSTSRFATNAVEVRNCRRLNQEEGDASARFRLSQS